MYSKGQVVIPEEIRKRLGLKAGSQFAVVGDKDTVILKAISPPSMEDFDELIAPRDISRGMPHLIIIESDPSDLQVYVLFGWHGQLMVWIPQAQNGHDLTIPRDFQKRRVAIVAYSSDLD